MMRILHIKPALCIALIFSGIAVHGQVISEPSAAEAEIKQDLTLRIVRARQYMQSVQLVFELSNRMEWLKHCWIGVSFYDREGEFLYRELPLMFTSLPADRSQRQEVWLESIDIEEIGTIMLRPILLETALREIFFDSGLLFIEKSNKYHFNFVFESDQ